MSEKFTGHKKPSDVSTKEVWKRRCWFAVPLNYLPLSLKAWLALAVTGFLVACIGALVMQAGDDTQRLECMYTDTFKAIMKEEFLGLLKEKNIDDDVQDLRQGDCVY